MEFAHSGVEALGDIRWGTHFCHFYHDQTDLIDTLVPFFKAGLENHERCLWITSEPFLAHDARSKMREAVPFFDRFEERGQIEIYNYSDWYLRTGQANADATLQSWIEREDQALARGYKGLRLTGNTYWLERKDWKAFTEYEAKVNQTFSKHRIIGLCSYCMSRSLSSDVFDVVRNHDFALLRQDGNWELLETASTKKAKDHLEKLNLDLRENLKLAKQAAESASELKTAFLANVSHEIRTPLNSILGFSQLINDEKISAELRVEFTGRIQRNGEALTRLIDDILDLSRIEADKLNLEMAEFSLRDLLNDIVGLHTPDAGSVSIHTECAANVPDAIVSDPARVRQILINLVRNAVKFTPAGEIRIKTTYDSSARMLQVTVVDSGIGISPAQQQELFQPFFQGDSSLTRKYGGTGLGLYLSRRLAQALGGDIHLQSSAPGQGSTFVAFISCQTLDHQPRTLRLNKSVGNRLRGLRLLLVDDTIDNQVLIQQYLKSSGADLVCASDGQEGVRRALESNFDLVLMDIQMPQMNGYAALKSLREQHYGKPIIALTAHAMLEERNRALAAGFDAHIAKPIERKEFLEKLNAVVQRGQVQSEVQGPA